VARFFAAITPRPLMLQAQRLWWTTPSVSETAEYHFYGALSRAASCEGASADQRRDHIDVLVGYYQQLQLWAENCPDNFEDCAALVGAEIGRIDRRELDAGAALRAGHPLGGRKWFCPDLLDDLVDMFVAFVAERH
jgi:hypothetical protein